MQALYREFRITATTRVLDVGGTLEIWSSAPVLPQLVMLNLPQAGEPACTYVEGDACHLPFADGSFDLVFSNSVIEHVGSREAQAQFARELARVGRGYWVQTPNRYFPIETHLLTPFVHWLPKSWSHWMIERFTIWELIVRPTADRKRWYIDQFRDQIRLLSAADMARLFPDAMIRKERFVLLTKSLIAMRAL
jgi:ubiquinone/menaquinone biosynthesis C-methylase UbiE